MTPAQLLDVAQKDHLYFLATGGCITFGGGEPLLHHDFIRSFASLCDNQWTINIETSLYAHTGIINELAPLITHWIVDIKNTNVTTYRSYTGRDNFRCVIGIDGNLIEITE